MNASQTQIIEEYSNLIPKEITKAIESIKNRKCRAILALLETEGEKSFSEIAKMLSLDTNDLTQNLKILQKSGLIVQHLEKRKDTRCKSWYDISFFGRDIIQKLSQAIESEVFPLQSFLDTYEDYPLYTDEDFTLPAQRQNFLRDEEVASISNLSLAEVEIRTTKEKEKKVKKRSPMDLSTSSRNIK